MKIKDLETSINNYIAYSNALRDNLAIIQEDLDKNPQSFSMSELSQIQGVVVKLAMNIGSLNFVIGILQDYSKLELNIRGVLAGGKKDVDMDSIIKYLQRFSTKEQQQILRSLGEGK